MQSWSTRPMPALTIAGQSRQGGNVARLHVSRYNDTCESTGLQVAPPDACARQFARGNRVHARCIAAHAGNAASGAQSPQAVTDVQWASSPPLLVKLLMLLQLACILTVLGIQMGCILEKAQARATVASSQQGPRRQAVAQQPTHSPPPPFLVDAQPLLLAVSFVAGLLASWLGPRRCVQQRLLCCSWTPQFPNGHRLCLDAINSVPAVVLAITRCRSVQESSSPIFKRCGV